MADNATNGRLAGSAVVAFAIGAAVGAGIALLYAPCSGGETRQFLSSKGRDVKNRLTGAADATLSAIGVRRSASAANV